MTTDKSLNEFLEHIENFKKITFPASLELAMKKACNIVESKAKANCPVDDGQLRGSITSGVKRVRDGIEGIVGSNVEYAPYVHEGTGLFARKGNGRKDVPWVYKDAKGNFYKTTGQKANPFLEKAMEEKKQEVIDCFKEIEV